MYASRDLRDDDVIVALAVERDGTALAHASQRLRADPAMVARATGSLAECEGGGVVLSDRALQLRGDTDTWELNVNPSSGALEIRHGSSDDCDTKTTVVASFDTPTE